MNSHGGLGNTYMYYLNSFMNAKIHSKWRWVKSTIWYIIVSPGVSELTMTRVSELIILVNTNLYIDSHIWLHSHIYFQSPAKIIYIRVTPVPREFIGWMAVWKQVHKHVQSFDGLVQKRRNSSVLAMELRLFCIKPRFVLPVIFCISDNYLKICNISKLIYIYDPDFNWCIKSIIKNTSYAWN